MFRRLARAVVVAGLAVLLLALASGRPASAAPTSVDPQPIRAVILVDESGSLSAADITQERNAAALIAQSEFSTRSQIAIVGFGSANGPSQSPVDVACPLTATDNGADRNSFAQCVNGLHPRTATEGQDTDFAKAIEEALSIMSAPAPTTQAKMIFLLTDGKLDVANSPSWGPDPALRDQAAERQLRQDLASAADQSIQVWPLGFGDKVDRAELNEFAALASRHVCGPAAPAPTARVVKSSADVVAVLAAAFASATCSNLGPMVTDHLASGATADLYVTVPAIATDGAIAVTKYEPAITVEFFQPGDDTPVPANAPGFSISGASGAVEVLRIVNPRPGRWRVHLSSPPGTPQRDVSATAIWQGNVLSSVTLSEPQPAPGQRVTVTVTIQTRSGYIVDAAELHALDVSASLTGDGFDRIDIPVYDNGTNGDARADDGQFTGTVVIPASATGALEFLGSVAGTGVAATNVPDDTTVYSGNLPVNVQVQLASPATVAPGATITGTVEVSNQSGTPAHLTLTLPATSAGLVVTVSPATFDSAADGTSVTRFTITVGANARLGPARLQLDLTAAGSPPLVLDREVRSFEVRHPPSWPEAHMPLLVALATALALAGVALLIRRLLHARHIRIGEIELTLSDGIRTLSQRDTTTLVDPSAKEFAFVIGEGAAGTPTIEHVDPATSGTYRIVRQRHDVIVLSHPGDQDRVHIRGEGFVELPDGLALKIRSLRGEQDASEDDEADRDDGDEDRWSTDPARPPVDDLLN